jgi:hypothetical protein
MLAAQLESVYLVRFPVSVIYPENVHVVFVDNGLPSAGFRGENGVQGLKHTPQYLVKHDKPLVRYWVLELILYIREVPGLNSGPDISYCDRLLLHCAQQSSR